MKLDNINKLTDAELEEQKLYYENRKAEFKVYRDECILADSILRDIKHEIQKRASMEKVGTCFKQKRVDRYICLINISFICDTDYECIMLEDGNFITIDDIDYTFITNNDDYVEIPKEEFLNQFLLVANVYLQLINPNMSMVFKKEETNDND